MYCLGGKLGGRFVRLGIDTLVDVGALVWAGLLYSMGRLVFSTDVAQLLSCTCALMIAVERKLWIECCLGGDVLYEVALVRLS